MNIFHYCSNSTFSSIIGTGKLRLSPLSESNDSGEGSYIASVFSEMCDVADIDPSLRDVSKVLVSTFKNSTEGFGLCLSEVGDLLSQWRAYAKDGTGFSLGFSDEFLKQKFDNVFFGSKFFEVAKVCYDRSLLEEMLDPIVVRVASLSKEFGSFVKIKEKISIEAAIRHFEDRETSLGFVFDPLVADAHVKMIVLLEVLSEMHFKIYNYKSPAFSEEREHRILRHRQREHFDEIQYFSADDKIKPYIEVELKGDAKNALVEVILGPKNRSNIDWVRAFLVSKGFGHVSVRKSFASSYR